MTNMYCIDYKLERPIYAIIRYWNDLSYNDNLSFIIIFETEEDYQNWLDNALEEQPYTGLTWRTLYRKATK